MAASSAERQSAVQLGAAVILIGIRELSNGQVPPPRQMLGVGIVFGALSFFEVAPDPWPNVASKFGWLIVLAMAMATVARAPNALPSLGQLAAGNRSLFNPAGVTSAQTAADTFGATAQTETV